MSLDTLESETRVRSILRCSNGTDCSGKKPVLQKNGSYQNVPGEAYSQSGHYRGLCINCIYDQLYGKQ